MLDTPSLIINEGQMERNIKKMAKTIKAYGVALRPHSKTHKNPSIAKKQIEAGAEGICAAKVSEAEVMAQNGITDIFIAYPVVTETKVKRAVLLSQKINLIVGVDSLAGAQMLSSVAKRYDTPIQVRLEVDIGYKRTGVKYDDAIKLAHQIYKMDYIDFKGIYTFRGGFMDGKQTLELEKAGLEEGQLMVDLANQMRKEGIPVKDISVGSTPTAIHAAKVSGITEVRPGTYVYYDRMQARIGACSLEECAAVVRVTVVSRPSNDLVIIDGGSKTFATDVGPNTEPLYLEGYGHIVEFPHAVIERFSEEHGMVNVRPNDAIKVGDVLHVIPNHICSTVNLHNKFYLESEGDYEEQPVLTRGMLF